MRVAATDDTTRLDPLATPAGAGDDGRRPDDGTGADTAAVAAVERRALAQELAALSCFITAVALAAWALHDLWGWPAVGLLAAALLGVAARSLGYHDPNRTTTR